MASTIVPRGACDITAEAIPGGWRFELRGWRSWTLNGERSADRYTRARAARLWLEQFAGAVPDGVTIEGTVEMVVTPLACDRRWLQDAGGCAPTAKAALDGLVKGGLLPDDDPSIVVSHRYLAPDTAAGADGLRIDVISAP